MSCYFTLGEAAASWGEEKVSLWLRSDVCFYSLFKGVISYQALVEQRPMVPRAKKWATGLCSKEPFACLLHSSEACWVQVLWVVFHDLTSFVLLQRSRQLTRGHFLWPKTQDTYLWLIPKQPTRCQRNLNSHSASAAKFLPRPIVWRQHWKLIYFHGHVMWIILRDKLHLLGTIRCS